MDNLKQQMNNLSVDRIIETLDQEYWSDIDVNVGKLRGKILVELGSRIPNVAQVDLVIDASTERRELFISTPGADTILKTSHYIFAAALKSAIHDEYTIDSEWKDKATQSLAVRVANEFAGKWSKRKR